MKTVNGKLQTVNFLRTCIFAIGVLLLPFAVFRLPSQVSAQTRLTYPIPELGYCRDAKECYLYCEIPENKAACWSYGKYRVGSDVLGVTTMSPDEKRMMEEKARQYGITFPIAELGNCAGPQECRDFCEQPANQTACMAFAKKKGFDKEMEGSDGMDATKRDELLRAARSELGCTSMESCSRVCESNPERCDAFARRHGVSHTSTSRSSYSSEEKQRLLEKARSELGCTSMESCKTTCEQNPQRCMEFAKRHGFAKREDSSGEQQRDTAPTYGAQRFGNGNCDSEESCKKYCQEHPDECPGFKGYARATEDGGTYMGPSGCRTEEECRSWCNDHPDTCPGFREGRAREESAKREYESRKKEREYQLEAQNRQLETGRELMMQQNDAYLPPTTSGSAGGGPPYQTTQPVPAPSYAPPSIQPAAP